MGWAIGVVLVAVAAGIVWWVRRQHRDEVFVGLTPGLFPVAGEPARTTRVARGSQGPVAVRFTPPDGVSPGLAGTLIDNEVNGVDIAATLVDLGVRRWVKLRALDDPQQRGNGEPGKGRTAKDWEIIAVSPLPEGDTLSPAESVVMRGLFAHSAVTTLSAVRRHHADVLREASVALYRETVQRGWFQRHPRQRTRVWVVVGVIGVLAALGAAIGPLLTQRYDQLGVAAGLLGASLLLFTTGRLVVPHTAAGSAVRAQTEGFKLYLETAEAEQLAVEAAGDIYSRYLPYAMVFGAVEHWNRVFTEAVELAHDRGIEVGVVFDWVDLTVLSAHLGADFLGLAVDGLLPGDLFGDLGDLTDGVGEFFSGVGDALGGMGDGCPLDGCGCDL